VASVRYEGSSAIQRCALDAARSVIPLCNENFSAGENEKKGRRITRARVQRAARHPAVIATEIVDRRSREATRQEDARRARRRASSVPLREKIRNRYVVFRRYGVATLRVAFRGESSGRYKSRSQGKALSFVGYG